MLKEIDKKWTETGMLRYEDTGPVSPGAVTRLFKVFNKKNGVLLGYVKWFVLWRRYCFFPTGTLFDETCLREITEFLQHKTAEHRVIRGWKVPYTKTMKDIKKAIWGEDYQNGKETCKEAHEEGKEVR